MGTCLPAGRHNGHEASSINHKLLYRKIIMSRCHLQKINSSWQGEGRKLVDKIVQIKGLYQSPRCVINFDGINTLVFHGNIDRLVLRRRVRINNDWLVREIINGVFIAVKHNTIGKFYLRTVTVHALSRVSINKALRQRRWRKTLYRSKTSGGKFLKRDLLHIVKRSQVQCQQRGAAKRQRRGVAIEPGDGLQCGASLVSKIFRHWVSNGT